jgi:glutathione synthase/RimK-type ligase-like ATP-grasp enzyme
LPALRVALATCALVPELTEDDRLLMGEMSGRGCDARPFVWDDLAVRWSQFHRVVIRSCWDYHKRLPEFLAWLDRLEADKVPLWNPASLVRANAHKSYLRGLQAAGLPVVPTVWLERGARADLVDLLKERGWAEAVVKPAVSASAFRTWRVSIHEAAGPQGRGAFRRLLGERDVLVQAFLPEIERDGEWSFVFFEGEFSHAVLKRPAPGDFRVQSEFGGEVLARSPSDSVLAEAERISHHIPRPWAYARIDAVEAQGVLTLMEVELIEPHLFLGTDPRAPGRFASAILSTAVDGRRG